ncbi:hypothetical protein O181_069384 [Austropuccinia psidii MF-1]|uniref:Uncharacterized protein n=1 Tax=Austropuccinia psidii MF-1 TaxID=1389203 RepID=A0A9Q3EZ79_9BASI|nr:hypothetical protein [Austropuccinia psidii MF-1]
MNSYQTERKFSLPPNTFKLLNGRHALMEKKNMMRSTTEWRKDHSSTTLKGAKTNCVTRSSNSNMKKQPQAQNKGKGKAPVTQTYNQGYIISVIQQEAMENVS